MVTPQEVAEVAALARLDLDSGELERLARELSSILDHVRELQAVPVPDEGAPSDVIEWPAPLRDDVIGPDPLQTPVADLSPHWRDGFFTVPRLAALDGDAS